MTYDPNWPSMFESEKRRLLDLLPNDLICSIEHFGSTAIPGMPANPIVDILVQVIEQEARVRCAYGDASEDLLRSEL